MKLDNYDRSIALAGRDSNAVSGNTGQNRVTNKGTWSELTQTRKKVSELIPLLYPLNVAKIPTHEMVYMRFTFVACFASKVGDIGMVGVEFQTLEFFVALYLKPYVKAIISTTPTFLFSLPRLHQFTIVGIPHGNWRMVAIPGFFIRT